jgi:hypothetical protein
MPEANKQHAEPKEEDAEIEYDLGIREPASLEDYGFPPEGPATIKDYGFPNEPKSLESYGDMGDVKSNPTPGDKDEPTPPPQQPPKAGE